MIRTSWSLLAALTLALMATGPAHARAPDPPRAQHTAPLWQVAYWNNRTLSGRPVVTDTDDALNHYWGNGAPRDGVNADRFSARWTRYIDVEPDTYRFAATSDDGIRVYVDSNVVIDQWYDHAPQTFTADVSLTDGHHLVTVEYYENMGGAVARVSWEPASAPPDVWRGEYFDNVSLSGAPRLVLNDAQVNFDWGYRSPAREIPNDHFSIRWTRTVHFEPGTYRFTATTDDGVRLWVNEHLLIDNWRDQALASRSGTIYLQGDVALKMEYYENGGVAASRLTWEREGQSAPRPPTGGAIVDDTDPGFVKGGSPSGWRAEPEGYGGHLTWTRSNDRRRNNCNWARWYPDLAAGRYEVFVYVPERYTTSSRARYWVTHRDGYALRLVDQSANGSRWVSLGTYWFTGSRSTDHVSLSDVTYEPHVSRLIAFDAVSWVPR